MDETSQHEVNKVLRVLNGTKLKYTCRVSIVERNEIVEFQSMKCPCISWKDTSRSLWVVAYTETDSYDGYPVMQFTTGAVMTVEVNP
jgi:hypothetical protein